MGLHSIISFLYCRDPSGLIRIYQWLHHHKEKLIRMRNPNPLIRGFERSNPYLALPFTDHTLFDYFAALAVPRYDHVQTAISEQTFEAEPCTASDGMDAIPSSSGGDYEGFEEQQAAEIAINELQSLRNAFMDVRRDAGQSYASSEGLAVSSISGHLNSHPQSSSAQRSVVSTTASTTNHNGSDALSRPRIQL